MKNSDNKKSQSGVGGTRRETGEEVSGSNVKNKIDKLKKPIIFTLMGVICFGCLYLIFKPSSDPKKEEIGLNDVIPQATDAGLQPDKQKAYEQELFEQKMQEKRDALMSLSDYLDPDSTEDEEAVLPDERNEGDYDEQVRGPRNGNTAVNSYRNAQSTLSSFYDNNDYENLELRRQLEELKGQLAEKEVPPSNTIQDQMMLMEKSYEMASRYLPSNSQQGKTDTTVSAKGAMQKEYFIPFVAAKKNAVSALYREPSDSSFLTALYGERNRSFHTAGHRQDVVQPKNSIRAVVQDTKVITDESNVRLRLLEAAQMPSRLIPAGAILTAGARFQGGRLQLKVASIELAGNIIPVDITVYDLDGQQGLYVPFSPEVNALTEVASNMSQTSGTSIMMTRSAGQQLASDLGRGVVQGVSGFFSRKLRTQKVTVKAGYQVFLVSKK